LVDGGCGLAHLFGVLERRGLVVLDLGDQQGTGRCGLLERFLTVDGVDAQGSLLQPELGMSARLHPAARAGARDGNRGKSKRRLKTTPVFC
jgi:hypothetical protein